MTLSVDPQRRWCRPGFRCRSQFERHDVLADRGLSDRGVEVPVERGGEQLAFDALLRGGGSDTERVRTVDVPAIAVIGDLVE